MGMTGDKYKDEYGLELPTHIDYYRNQTRRQLKT